jgi:hypothetical protein
LRCELLIIIPLVLSAVTHLWNPSGFPSVHTDEGHYMNRAMHLVDGIGPHEEKNIYTRSFDHPYFGQIFLAAALQLVGYPDLLTAFQKESIGQIEMIYLVPRVLMGVLAVIDTFLVFKIAERRYNKTIAFIAAILFAVMPFSWILRRILLDNLLLPFLLSSILFALFLEKQEKKTVINRKNLTLILLSGIFLGLTIFTKIPAFAFIPLLSLILLRRTKNVRSLPIWFIPVLLVPAIWPAYALYAGDFEEWKEDVLWQATQRVEKPLVISLQDFIKIDPVLFSLGISGLIFACIRRDYFIILFAFPYLIFLYLVGFTNVVHMMALMPAICISGAALIDFFSNKFRRKKVRHILPVLVTLALCIFGLTSNLMILQTNMTSSYFETIALVLRAIPSDNDVNNHDSDRVTLVGHRWVPGFSWVLDRIYDKDLDYQKFFFRSEMETDKFILIVERGFKSFLSNKNASPEDLEYANMLFNNSSAFAKNSDIIQRYNYDIFPYNSMHDNRRIGEVEIRKNY